MSTRRGAGCSSLVPDAGFGVQRLLSNARVQKQNIKGMAFPVRLVFTPFVVVVGCKYFLPVPGCLF